MEWRLILSNLQRRRDGCATISMIIHCLLSIGDLLVFGFLAFWPFLLCSRKGILFEIHYHFSRHYHSLPFFLTVFLQYYLSIYVIPIVNNIKPPINVDTLPYFLFKIFPRFKPKYVNIKLIIENIEAANRDLFVIAGNPIPVVKLSMLTDSPNIKYPGILIRNFSSFSLNPYQYLVLQQRDAK